MRKRLPVVVLLLAVAGAVLLIPESRQALRGWLRGEPCYRGFPTSYWRGKIQRWDSGSTSAGLLWPDLLRRVFGIVLRRNDAPFAYGDPAGVGVAVDLLADEDAKVRRYAISALETIFWDPSSTRALEREMARALKDPGRLERTAAELRRRRLALEAMALARRLGPALKDDDPAVRAAAARVLGTLLDSPPAEEPAGAGVAGGAGP